MSYIDSKAGVTITLAVSTQHGGIAEGDKLSGIENLTGSNLNDTLSGNSGANVIVGGNGNDLLSGGGGDDTLDGGAGNDILRGGPGRDHFIGGAGFDTVDYSQNGAAITLVLNGPGSSGDAIGDTFVTSGPPIAVVRDVEKFIGTALADVLRGSEITEILDGGAGNDLLESGGGLDTLVGGVGSDTLRSNFNHSPSNETLVGGQLIGDTVVNDGATDLFVVMTQSNPTVFNLHAFGLDVIRGFEDDVDLIGVDDLASVDHTAAAMFTNLQSEATFSNGSDAGGQFLLIAFNASDDEIKVYGLSVASFSAADLFVI